MIHAHRRPPHWHLLIVGLGFGAVVGWLLSLLPGGLALVAWVLFAMAFLFWTAHLYRETAKRHRRVDHVLALLDGDVDDHVAEHARRVLDEMRWED